MTRIVRLTFLILLTASAVTPLNGQTPPPFDAWRRDLNRVVDSRLEQLRIEAARPAVALPPADPVLPQRWPGFSELVPSGVPPQSVATAQRRLLTLGVDAARIFAAEGVPPAMIVIAAVESNYDPLALSPKGARGLWQFMPDTARRLGLTVNEQEDDRIHPTRSTRAAARYLRELYARFDDWPLALAAYNAGEARVAAAVQRGSTRDFWRLSELRLLPLETRSYVPSVLPFGRFHSLRRRDSQTTTGN